MSEILRDLAFLLGSDHTRQDMDSETARPGRPLRIAVACGGTGGHMFPGLATARILLQRGHQVSLWVVGREAERDAVRSWDGPMVCLQARGLQGGVWQRALAMVGLLRAVTKALACMLRNRPDVVLGMGSYASIGPGLAAWLLRVPLVLHEGNAVPGRAIRMLAPLAKRIGTGFSQANRRFHVRNVCYCGFPLRADFLDAAADTPASARTQLLVMGGSQGAAILNQMVPAALQRYRDMGGRLPPVVHMAGHREQDAVARHYRSLGIQAQVLSFCEDMAALLRETAFAITRAGAATCTELAAMQVPGILIPLPHAPGNHQWHNAQALARTGAYTVLAQSDLTAETLAHRLQHVFMNSGELDQRARHLPAGIVVDGGARLAKLVEDAARPSKGNRRVG